MSIDRFVCDFARGEFCKLRTRVKEPGQWGEGLGGWQGSDHERPTPRRGGHFRCESNSTTVWEFLKQIW